LKKNLNKMTSKQYDDIALLNDYDYILGVDEVGRGCLAGPVTVCCTVITRVTLFLEGVRDSKKASKKLRNTIFKNCSADKKIKFFISDIFNNEIDEIGISKAIQAGISTSVEEILKGIISSSLKGILLIDGYFKEKFPLNIESKMILKGDDKCYSIGLASILAKVHRDQLMQEISNEYPQFGFSKNVGYGTKEHLTCLRKFGYTKYHRKSFEPLKSLIFNNSISPIKVVGA